MTETALRRIVVIGDEACALFAAALLSKRCGVAGCEVTAVAVQEQGADDTVFLRPETLRYFSDLGVDPAKLVEGGVGFPIFSTEVGIGEKTHRIPFSPYGPVRYGVEFHQLWMRWSLSGGKAELESFSRALAVDESGARFSWESAASIGQEFGLLLDRRKFTGALRQLAGFCGVLIENSGSSAFDCKAAEEWAVETTFNDRQLDADFVVDLSETGMAANALGLEDDGWSGPCLWLPQKSGMPGMELGSLYASLALFLSLLPGRGISDVECYEFNRVYECRKDRTDDMRALLSDDSHDVRGRPALVRKIEVFEACGRVPTEDYEVFSPGEWLAALLAVGHRPKRYDRLADRLPEVELQKVMEGLIAQLGGLKVQLRDSQG